jgi:hypothetical protein
MPYYLKLLDLSYNNLTKNSIKFLNLCENNELNELYMQWNKLLGEGGYLLFKDLIENKNLKVYFLFKIIIFVLFFLGIGCIIQCIRVSLR